MSENIMIHSLPYGIPINSSISWLNGLVSMTTDNMRCILSDMIHMMTNGSEEKKSSTLSWPVSCSLVP